MIKVSGRLFTVKCAKCNNEEYVLYMIVAANIFRIEGEKLSEGLGI